MIQFHSTEPGKLDNNIATRAKEVTKKMDSRQENERKRRHQRAERDCFVIDGETKPTKHCVSGFNFTPQHFIAKYFLILVHLLMQEVKGQLQTNGLHVCLLQCRGDVHVHIKEPLQHPALLSLLDLQLRE